MTIEVKTEPEAKEAPAVATPQGMSLAQKLLAIERDMPEIKKTGHNENLGYDFVEQQAIMNAVRPLLIEHGVLVVPTVTKHEIKNKLGTDKKTGAEITAGVKSIVSLTFKFINTDNPADVLNIDWTAEGDDWGDKGTNKATTIAQKNMYIRLFNIADTDPDAEAPAGGALEAPSKAITTAKQTNIYRMIRRLGQNVEDYEAKLGKAVAKMTNAEADSAIELMQAAIERRLASGADTE